MHTMLDLTSRSLEPEWMDDPAIDPAMHTQALRGLARINVVSRSDAILWPAIRDHADRAKQPIRVLDVACGGGDVLIQLARRAQRAQLDIQWLGCDQSPTALNHAKAQACRSGITLDLHQLDALRDPLPESIDIAVASLFLHHLTPDEAVQLLKRMAASAKLIVINDLQRNRMGYLAAYMGTRLLSRSPVVHRDGPQSVRAAWTCDEVSELAQHAGLSIVSLERCWPFRMRLIAQGGAA